MANPFKQIDERERGTVVYWDRQAHVGRIKADNGDTVRLSDVSAFQGFERLAPGQRVEFTRIGYGLRPDTAAVVVPIRNDSSSN